MTFFDSWARDQTTKFNQVLESLSRISTSMNQLETRLNQLGSTVRKLDEDYCIRHRIERSKSQDPFISKTRRRIANTENQHGAK